MNKKGLMILAAAVAGTALLAGCSAGTGAAGGQAVSQGSAGAASSGISTNGEGVVKVSPDMSEITFSVYTEGGDAKSVKDKNAEDNNSVIEFLRAEGFSDESINTVNLGLNPVYDYSGAREILKGYEMETEIRVTDIELSKLGAVIDAAVDNGINTIKNIRYFVSDYDAKYNEALTLAVETARKKAETLAEAGGISLGEVTSISEYGSDSSVRYVSGLNNFSARYAAKEEMASAADAALIMPGQVEIKADVTVGFSIK